MKKKISAQYKVQRQKLSLVSEETNVFSTEPVISSYEMHRQLRMLVKESGFDISYQEHFFLIGFNTNNLVKIFAHISTGGCTATIADSRIIFSHLLLAGCTQFAIAHNHPSGTTRPSEVDKTLTKKLSEAGKLLDMSMIDHIILVPNEHEYYSFVDENMM